MQSTPDTHAGHQLTSFVQGAPVYDMTGAKVGTVSEHGVQRGYLVVHHGLLRADVYVPLGEITRQDNRGVHLAMGLDQFNHLAHNHPPASAPDQAVDHSAPTGEVTDEVTTEGVTFTPPPAERVGESGQEMNETGGWSNLGNRDLATGMPASAEVRGETPSWPDGNNVAGMRQGPDLVSDQPVMTIGGQPVGNDTGVMGTGAGPVGTSFGPGVLESGTHGDVTVVNETMGGEGAANANTTADATTDTPVARTTDTMASAPRNAPARTDRGGAANADAISNSRAGTEFTGTADAGIVGTSDSAADTLVRDASIREQVRADQPPDDLAAPERNTSMPLE